MGLMALKRGMEDVHDSRLDSPKESRAYVVVDYVEALNDIVRAFAQRMSLFNGHVPRVKQISFEVYVCLLETN